MGCNNQHNYPSHVTFPCTYGWVEIDEDGPRDIFSGTGLSEEGLERTGLANVSGLWVGTAIRLEAVLEKVAVSRQLCSWSVVR